ncbi:Reverse transcriptase (plasmid) [Roseomonas mucosa]|uniref:Reverse transcriptase n=1 Tax=Roseomonas mucosa TaxID=207340 RepID=A0A4Y1MRC9_9PROT|nr:Reverse transcriptase [Roseomonas mucosa]AWV20074.1 Reverse transcriptase [Roseomonas mucosa]
MTSTARDQLSSIKNLQAVWKAYWPRVRNSTAGVDGILPRTFNDNLTRNLSLIRTEINEGYIYAALRGVRVPKKDPSKFRIICVPTVQDRLVQRALLQAIEQRAIKLGIANDVSFGFVKDSADVKRGAVAARNVAVSHRQRRPWAFKTDISAFFDRIPRNSLADSFRRAFSLSSLHSLVAGAIACEVDDSNPLIRRTLESNGIRRGEGLRQGMPLSPILSNFLLRDFDRAFVNAKLDLVRYADDLVVFADSEAECFTIAQLATEELGKLGLKLSPDKTEICPPDKPVEFLGMELGLKPGTPTYCLTISDQQCQRIRESFTELHDVDFALKENLNLPKLLLRLSNMKAGYRAAYNIAENFEDLKQKLDQWSDNCVVKLYSSIFGKDVIAKLHNSQKRFLLLP